MGSKEIRVIDNFLPENTAEDIAIRLLGSWFPWYLSDGINYSSDGEYQFVHNFYKENSWVTFEQDVVIPIIDKLNPQTIVKIKANLTCERKPQDAINYHVDTNIADAVTAIYYVNDNDGKTIFKDTGEVNCVKNRLVIFPASIMHTGLKHTDTKVFGGKCVINLNFIE